MVHLVRLVGGIVLNYKFWARKGRCPHVNVKEKGALGDISNTSSIANDGGGKNKVTRNGVGKEIVLHEVNLVTEELFDVVVKQGQTSKRGLGGEWRVRSRRGGSSGRRRGGRGEEEETRGWDMTNRGEGGNVMGHDSCRLQVTDCGDGYKFSLGLDHGRHDQNKVHRRRNYNGVAK
ncbi:hypothetical protein LIER_20272 [Lithospermum erythrorhizon]|uniref:Uncharacterized protein n=1 Tax=Lithospermum erythrorhizon TaxID=34254 RepID=A0AAV3QKY5_LITER